MLCVVIQGPSFSEACAQIERNLAYADLFEFRLDLFDQSCLDSVAKLRASAELPVLFTLRSPAHFHWKTPCKAALHPAGLGTWNHGDFLDVEFPVDGDSIEKIRQHFPGIKMVLSFHSFEDVPENLDSLYCEMKKTPAFFYKIAVSPKNSLETMRFLLWAKKNNTEQNLIAVPMGEHGQFGRILAPVLGFPLMFASDAGSPAPAAGMLSAQILVERYRYHEKTVNTVICGLIGNPVFQSPSDVSHNAFFRENRIDAVYVKIVLNPDELGPFLECAKQMPFRGLSVTMPLKECAGQFMDEIDALAAEIGSINTIKFEEGRLFGYNTDAEGVKKVLEAKGELKGLHAVVLGAGGASRAAIYVLRQAGSRVTILNRSSKKAEALAHRFNCDVGDLDSIPENYDLLVNSTPLPLPIVPEKIFEKRFVFDMVIKPRETLFIQEAKKKNCKIAYGSEMFIHQAIAQFKIWFPRKALCGKSGELLAIPPC